MSCNRCNKSRILLLSPNLCIFVVALPSSHVYKQTIWTESCCLSVLSSYVLLFSAISLTAYYALLDCIVMLFVHAGLGCPYWHQSCMHKKHDHVNEACMTVHFLCLVVNL